MADRISAPAHYTFSTVEPINVIYAWRLDFSLGNVVKYIARAGRKEGSTMIEDLKKARQYLDFEIDFLEKDSAMPQSATGRFGKYGETITESDLREMYMDDGR